MRRGGRSVHRAARADASRPCLALRRARLRTRARCERRPGWACGRSGGRTVCDGDGDRRTRGLATSPRRSSRSVEFSVASRSFSLCIILSAASSLRGSIRHSVLCTCARRAREFERRRGGGDRGARLHLRRGAAMAAAPWAFAFDGDAALALHVLPQVTAQQLLAAPVVRTAHGDARAISREVARHVTPGAHPQAALLAELAEALQVGDQPLGEPIAHHVRRLHRRSALRALRLLREPLVQARLAKDVPAQREGGRGVGDAERGAWVRRVRATTGLRPPRSPPHVGG